jgi:hypothetical protein
MIAVVHLVWGPLGVSPLRRFLDSYRRHPAGAEHDLVVLFNNVSERLRSQLAAELEHLEHSVMTIDGPVQDLAAYLHAASRVSHDHLCFLNSYSEILAPGWLAKLNSPLMRQDVGLVGATGSWASLRSSALNTMFLPNPYKNVMPRRHVAECYDVVDLTVRGNTMADERVAVHASRKGRSLAKAAMATFKALPSIPEQILRFPSFPARHLRTNAFMVERPVFTSLQANPIKRKIDAYALESGHESLTRQITERGLQTLIVDRDGDVYQSHRWPDSHVFWQGNQEKLLVADNQTAAYADGDLNHRRMLSIFAWGAEAQPELSTQRICIDDVADPAGLSPHASSEQ